MQFACPQAGSVTIAHLELLIDPLEVRFHRIETNDEFLRYLLPGVTGHQQSQHALLLRGQIRAVRRGSVRYLLLRLGLVTGKKDRLEIGAQRLPADGIIVEDDAVAANVERQVLAALG